MRRFLPWAAFAAASVVWVAILLGPMVAASLQDEAMWREQLPKPAPTAMFTYLEQCGVCNHRIEAETVLEQMQKPHGLASRLLIPLSTVRSKSQEQVRRGRLGIDASQAFTTGTSAIAWNTASGGLAGWFEMRRYQNSRAEREAQGYSAELVEPLGDGETLVTSTDKGMLWYWDAATKDRRRMLTVSPRRLAAMVATPKDPELLAWLDDDGQLGFAGRTVQPMRHADATAIAFDRTNGQLVSVSRERIARWNPADGKEVQGITIETYGTPIGLSSDGALGFFPVAENMEIWDTRSGKKLQVLAGHQEDTEAACSDGGAIVTGDGTGRIRVWDRESGALRATLQAHAVKVNHLDCRGDRALSIGKRYYEAKVWDLTRMADFPPRHAAPHKAWSTTDGLDWKGRFAVSPAGQWIQDAMPGLVDWFTSEQQALSLAAFLGFGALAGWLVLRSRAGSARRQSKRR